MIPEHGMNPMLSIPTEADWAIIEAISTKSGHMGSLPENRMTRCNSIFAKYQSKRLRT